MCGEIRAYKIGTPDKFMRMRVELTETTLMESASPSTLPPAGHMFGHSLLVKSPVLIISQALLVMNWLVIFLLIVILKFSVDLYFGSLSSMEEMCLLFSKSCHFLLSVTLK